MGALKTAITDTNVSQVDLVEYLENVKTLANELKTDYAALLADVTEIRTKLIATHAKLDADAGVTDTNYGTANNPAALTATSIAAADLKLTAG